ncbi:MAG TPA: hypothetical protein VML75_16810 [Kofleriaceae bacterium]|nr:hypothetical protein [Kofleriaceae bacterium]
MGNFARVSGLTTGVAAPHPYRVNGGESEPLVAGAWWGYAEGDATIVGLVVAAVAIFAIVYVVSRVRKKR